MPSMTAEQFADAVARNLKGKKLKRFVALLKDAAYKAENKFMDNGCRKAEKQLRKDAEMLVETAEEFYRYI